MDESIVSKTRAKEDQIARWIRAELRRRYGHDFGFEGQPQPAERPDPSAPNWDLGQGMPWYGVTPEAVAKVTAVIRDAQAGFDLETGDGDDSGG